jgi:DNA-binding MarR family transcriptional regulator
MVGGSGVTTTVNRCSMIGLVGHLQRLRADNLGRDLFTIPAFEMLLDLYTHQDAMPRSLTALTAASSTSERNSQRIVHRLAERGMVELSRDPTDGRRIIVELTPETDQILDNFFDRLVELSTDWQSRAAAKT